MATPDPFEPYLNRAASLFDLGDIVQAGQIWQAILKRDPDHQAARAGLYKVKLCFDARATQEGMVPPPPPPAPKPQPQPEPQPEPDHYQTAKRLTLNAQAAEAEPERAPAPPPPEPDPEVLLRDGCTLYELGEVTDALRKWEQILAANPDHPLARSYANGARKELGLPPLEGGVPVTAPPAPAVEEPPAPGGEDAPEGRAAVLVREGVQLYDMGMVEEATEKWRRVLAAEPGNAFAAEYLAMAQRDLDETAARQRQAAPAPPRPQVPPSAPSAPAPVVLKIQMDRRPEAPVPVQPLVPPVRKDPSSSPRLPSLPPKAITTRATPQRDGLKVPGPLKGLALPAWLDTPRKFGLALGGVLAALAVLLVLGQFQRERALREAVLAARAEALKPVARQVEVASLVEAPEAIRQEGQDALAEDPLVAYYRAQECLRLDQGDTKAGQLRDQARTRMASRPPSAKDNFDKSLKEGDLEGSQQAIRGLLCQNPEDPELKAKARLVCLALAQRYASKERFGDAKDCLSLVRAMYPQETIWPAKLKLLKAIQGLPKADQASWIPMLG